MELIINIDKDICTGCGECAKICPVEAISGQRGEAHEIDVNKCVMCGQCVQKCKSYISIIEHGAAMYAQKRAERNLPDTLVEPLFAAYNNCHVLKVKEALLDKDVFTIVQCAPAVRVGIAEDFGFGFGTLSSGKLAEALRCLGFDRVYDTNFAADLTIMEEGSELLHRVANNGKLPMITSCCPAWVKHMENTYPELKDNLSSCKSPQQMGGAIFKTYGAKIDKITPSKIFSVSVMPCTCKAYECERPEMKDSGYKDVDAVLTTRELAYLIRNMGVDFGGLSEGKFDEPLGIYSGAGQIFGSTGGVMEAALRTCYELITKKELPEIEINEVRGTGAFRKATFKAGDVELRAGVITGLENVAPILEDIKSGKSNLHFIEIMTCPAGCVSGGGQPKLLVDTDKGAAYDARINSVYEHDRGLPIRKSHENPAIQKLYKEFLDSPLSDKPHHLLHTEYCLHTTAND